MDKHAVTSVLSDIAAYLELVGEDPFRVRAYHSAARAVQSFHGDLRQALDSGQLAELKGVGPTTLEVITEVLERGSARMLDDLRDKVPPGLVEMLGVSGLGVAKVRQVHDALHIETLEELEEAARDGRLAQLPRFGPKTADKVLRGIHSLHQVREYWLLHHARREAESLRTVLAGMPGVRDAVVAGSVRRAREVIRDLDFVIQLDERPDALVERLKRATGVQEFVKHTDRTVTLRFASGTVADIYWSTPEQFGFQLVHATGSVEHVAQLAARATERGLEWRDTGLYRDNALVLTPSEDVVYRLLALPFIAPELREGRGELAAALAGRLPTLLTQEDLKGFLHCHSNYSDGDSTVGEWVEACRPRGYRYVGITDHSEAMSYSGGLAVDRIAEQHAEIDRVNAANGDLPVLKGVEADILEDGSLDYTSDVRATFDFIIASVHLRHGMNEEQMTERILHAMDDPTMVILGHPTGRLLLSRDPFPMNLERIFAKAAAAGIAIEINADPQRLDLDWRWAQDAAAAGVTISLGAVAHSVAGVANMELGVAMARKGWLTADQVLNTRSLEAFREFVARRRTHR